MQALRKLQDRYVGLFKILERIGETAYRLDLSASNRQALRGLHNVFHVSLLWKYRSNGLDYEAPPIKIDGEEQYEVEAIWKHRVICNEMQYLVKWVGYDKSENLWLTAGQLDSAKKILEAYRRKNRLGSVIVHDIIRCSHCDMVHVDAGKYAHFNHIRHVC